MYVHGFYFSYLHSSAKDQDKQTLINAMQTITANIHVIHLSVKTMAYSKRGILKILFGKVLICIILLNIHCRVNLTLG